jgi:hypothetical protein
MASISEMIEAMQAITVSKFEIAAYFGCFWHQAKSGSPPL